MSSTVPSVELNIHIVKYKNVWRKEERNTYNYIPYLQNRCGHPWENKIQRKLRGVGEAQLCVPGHFERSCAHTGMCFEAPGARPLITGSGLFEDSLRGNKNPEMEEYGWRLEDRKRTSHHLKRGVESFLNIGAWMDYSSVTTPILFQFHWLYLFIHLFIALGSVHGVWGNITENNVNLPVRTRSKLYSS